MNILNSPYPVPEPLGRNWEIYRGPSKHLNLCNYMKRLKQTFGGVALKLGRKNISLNLK